MSGTTSITMIMGVATSDRALRLFNAVISTGREARDIGSHWCRQASGYNAKTKDLVEQLERLTSLYVMGMFDSSEISNVVRDARTAVRTFINRCVPVN